MLFCWGAYSSPSFASGWNSFPLSEWHRPLGCFTFQYSSVHGPSLFPVLIALRVPSFPLDVLGVLGTVHCIWIRGFDIVIMGWFLELKIACQGRGLDVMTHKVISTPLFLIILNSPNKYVWKIIQKIYNNKYGYNFFHYLSFSLQYPPMSFLWWFTEIFIHNL